jgi:hypothetical protein
MGRSAYSGRNWEGFSPDPYLSGVTMEKSVRGLQDAGVQATAKHWLLNEQEILRNPVSYPNGTLRYESLSSNVDDRTVRKCCSCDTLAFARYWCTYYRFTVHARNVCPLRCMQCFCGRLAMSKYAQRSLKLPVYNVRTKLTLTN